MTRRRGRKSKSSNQRNLRINLLFYVFTFISALFIYRLFTIQVLDHEKYTALAKEQHWGYQDIPSKRGDILSSDGFPLATTQISYLLYAEPNKIEDINKYSTDIAEVLSSFTNSNASDLHQSYLENKERISTLLEKDLYWIALASKLTPEQKDAIAALDLEHIGFEDHPVRYYPEGFLASHVLGFVASNEEGEDTGYYGVEGRLNGDLRGKPGRILEERDATGAPILVGGYTKINPIDGRDIVLTINRAVQFIVERRLKEGVINTGAKSGTAIVMDPRTGDIIAMANYPSYDPSDFNDEATESTSSFENERRNSAISETYEPGSVIKALTVASAIDSGLVSPHTTFIDSGPVTYSDYTIDNWDKQHHGEQTIIQLLQKSNNIGSAWVGHLVGAKRLSSYFTDFGLGSLTGIDLEGEDTGVIHDYNSWTDIDLATAAFGQGISATPLQVLAAFNSIANKGVLMQPRIISQIIDEGEVINLPPKEVREVLSPESAATVSDMLVQAVEGGESKYFNLKNYDIAGKTGTAQIPVEGEYDPNKTNATFVGYMENSKRYSMIVRLKEPESSVYAAETAVPLWMSITQDLINYFGISEDK